MQDIKIGNKVIGKGKPCFIIAEAGNNHNGEIGLAKKLVDLAVETGADSVKFQRFVTEKAVSKHTLKGKHNKIKGEDVDLLEALKKVELTDSEYKELFDYCSEKGIIFFASAFDEEGIEFFDRLGMQVFKIASCDITDFPLLKKFAETKKPLVLSTGMSSLAEVRTAFNFLRDNGAEEVALMHCLAEYPAIVQETNLNAIKTLEKEFDVPAGFSDHSTGTFIPAIAVAAGAKLFEKHITLDKEMWGFDQKASADPADLKKIVAEIRLTEKALGNGVKKPTASELELRKAMRRSIVANVDIGKGTEITREVLEIKRPGTGLGSDKLGQVLGKKAKRDIKEDELVLLEDLE